MIRIKEKANNGIISYKQVTEMSDAVRNAAVQKFGFFREKGTILNNDFQDMEWKLNDQKKNYSIRFGYRTDELKELACAKGVSLLTFINDLKTFICLKIGTCAIEFLRALVKYTIDETLKSGFFTIGAVPSGILHADPLLFYTEFLDLRKDHYVPGDYIRMCRDAYIAYSAAEKAAKKDPQPVTLNEFRSYFLLSDILNEYWTSQRDAGTAWKQYYYPFYLFWRVTTILPLRVTEFCVTPYDCISRKDGRFYLTIRRSRLKGSSHIDPIIRSYTLETDYKLHTYEITKDIYESIAQYQKITERYRHPYDTLFSNDHLLSLGVGTLRTADSTKTFSSLELNTIMRDFFDHVVCVQFGLTIVNEASLMRRAYDDDNGIYEMGDDEIMLPQSKHTRHLAMINLIIRGCNPMLIKDFAGHVKVQTSEKYYSNIVKTVRCTVSYYYEKSKMEITENSRACVYRPKFNPVSVLDHAADGIPVDGGACNCFGGCLASGFDCEICRHFTPNAANLPEYRKGTEKLEKTVEEEMKYFRQLMTCSELDEKMSTLQLEAQKAMTDLSGLAMRYFKQFESEKA